MVRSPGLERIVNTVFLASVAAAIGTYNARPTVLTERVADNNLEEVAEEQERVFGFDVRILPEVSVYFENPSLILGMYHDGEDGISLNAGELATPPSNPFEAIEFYVKNRAEENIISVLRHEMAHWYQDQLSEDLLGEDWPSSELERRWKPFPDFSLFSGFMTPVGISNAKREWREDLIQNYLAVKMISEGVSSYLQYGDDFPYEDVRIPDRFSQLNPESFFEMQYKKGYYLVKPVIERFGAEGVEYMIRNPPYVDELSDLNQYQGRVVEELGS